jgi:GNAT superfamily N-acetyltransferase
MKNQVVQLEPADLPSLRLLMDKANRYSYEKSGEYLWKRLDVASKQVKGHLLAGQVFGAKDAKDRIIAMLALADRDTYIWGDRGLDGSALYLHKLMKDPSISMPGIGHWLIGFAASRALDLGKVLRCDTKPSLESLVNYYQQLGFKVIGETAYPSTKEPALQMEANPEDVVNRIRVEL